MIRSEEVKAMRASELPYDVKQQFLQQIESQLGSDVYRRAVGSLGEDGLIDSVLAKHEEARPQKRIGWGDVGSTLVVLLIAYGAGLALLGGEQWWHHLLALPVGFLWFLSWNWLPQLIGNLWNLLFGSH